MFRRGLLRAGIQAFDPTGLAYKQCARAVEGTCQQWGAACAPSSHCMFDPADGLHHACDEVAGGSRWGRRNAKVGYRSREYEEWWALVVRPPRLPSASRTLPLTT